VKRHAKIDVWRDDLPRPDAIHVTYRAKFDGALCSPFATTRLGKAPIDDHLPCGERPEVADLVEKV